MALLREIWILHFSLVVRFVTAVTNLIVVAVTSTLCSKSTSLIAKTGFDFRCRNSLKLPIFAYSETPKSKRYTSCCCTGFMVIFALCTTDENILLNNSAHLGFTPGP